MADPVKHGGLWWRALLAVFVAVSAFVAADALYFRLRFGPVALYLENHPVYHHRLIPNASTIAWLPGEYYTVVRANSLGLRGREIDSPKPAGRFRVVVLGDSFTMGKGVEENETFPALLETRLRNAGLPVADLEVVNAGVDSFSPLLEFLLLREEWKALDPDVVVLAFDMSDLLQDTLYEAMSHETEQGALRGVSSDESQSLDMSGYDALGRFLNHHTLFTAQFYRWLNPPGDWAVAHLATPELLLHTLKPTQDDFPEQWRTTLRNLHRIATLCRERDVPLVLAVYPWAHQVGDDVAATAMREFLAPGHEVGARTFSTLRTFAERYDLPFVNATPAFRSRQGDTPLYYELDIHWTPAGHEVMAEALAPVVERVIRARLQFERSAAS